MCVGVHTPTLSLCHDYENHRVKVRLQDQENSHQVMKDNTTVIAVSAWGLASTARINNHPQNV